MIGATAYEDPIPTKCLLLAQSGHWQRFIHPAILPNGVVTLRLPDVVRKSMVLIFSSKCLFSSDFALSSTLGP